MRRVFYVGLPRTGTSSLRAALMRLGYVPMDDPFNEARLRRFYSGNFNLDREVGCSAFGGEPIAPFYQDLAQCYPDAQFILTVRKPDDWIASVRRYFSSWKAKTPLYDQLIDTLHCSGRFESPVMELCLAIATGGFDFSDEKLLMTLVTHTMFVIAEVRDLLAMDICAGSGWEPLCEYLGRSVPDEPFPHCNASE